MRFLMGAAVLMTALSSWANADEVMVPTVEAVQLEQKDARFVANAQLDAMREQVKNSAEKSSGFSLFGPSMSALDEALLHDLNDYLVVYGDLPLSVEAVQLKAILHNRFDQHEALAMDFLYIISAYSGSRYEAASRKGLQELLADALKYEEPILGTLLTHDFTAKQQQKDRLFDLLKGLSELKSDKFDAVIAQMSALFLVRYPNYAKADVVQDILAHHQAENYHVAIYQYQKLMAVYPSSALKANALFSIAETQRTGLKEYQDAANNYKQVIERFPHDVTTKTAYLRLGLTQSLHLKQYQEALFTLNQVVEKYPDDVAGKEGLQMLGEIYAKKTKEYAKAVASYRKLSDIFSGDDGLEALQQAEKIASQSMRDYPLVIAIDEQVVRDYGDREQAVEALMNIGDVYEKKLKRKTDAIKAYQRVIESYPSSKQAKEASSNIRQLEKES